MGKIEEIVPRGVNWNKFREYYDSLLFSEREELSVRFDSLFPKQRYFHKGQFVKMLNMIDGDIKVVEFGCHDGSLAKETIPHVKNISMWYGFDFNTFSDRCFSIDKFKFIPLEKWFHDTKLPEFNVFVSSHSIEHISDIQALKLLKHVSTAKHCLFEIPINDEGRSWHNWGCSHVLTWGRIRLREIMNSLGYDLFYNLDSVGVTGWLKRDNIPL